MNQWDEARLQEMREDDRREETRRERRRLLFLIVGGLLAVAFTALVVWSRHVAANAGHELHFFGQPDTEVQVEIEGEDSFVIPVNGSQRITPSRPGEHHLRFTALKTGTSYEQTLDIPGPDPEGEAVLAVATREGECFVSFDVSAWYSGNSTLMELASDRAEGTQPKGSGLPPGRPYFESRMKALDPLPSRYIHRHWALPSFIDPGDEVFVVLETECSALIDTDARHIERLIEIVTK